MSQRTRVLITGGCGFVGGHICEHILHNTAWDVIILDRLTYAGTLERLRDTKREFGARLRSVFHDFRAAFSPTVLRALGDIRYVIHNGAESHVARSLEDPEPFVMSNVLGTMHVLNACRMLSVEHIIYVSTDEVHGPAPDGVDFQEDAPIRPSNPYSASKAGGEALAYAYWKSFRLPTTLTRTMNLYGERQNSEKMIPMCIRKILAGDVVTIHGDNTGRVGSRKWLHARNQADALLYLLTAQNELPDGHSIDLRGETFHIAGEEHTNLAIAQMIAGFIGKPLNYEIVDFHRSHPGHDLRYSLDDSRLRSMGWRPPVPFEESLRRTVEWAIRKENSQWLL